MDPNHSPNNFELWRDGRVIAACPSLAAHDAARRLLAPNSFGETAKDKR